MTSKKTGYLLGAVAGAGVMAAAVAGAGMRMPEARADQPQAGLIKASTTPIFAPPPGAPMSFADIFDRVSPAVVSINVTSRVNPSDLRQIPGFPFNLIPRQPDGGEDEEGGQTERGQPRLPTQQSAGSGFFISADGYIVTNNHVVENAEKITVVLKDETELEATVVGRDEATDIAVIKVKNGKGPFPFVNFENSARPRVGDWVITVGNPFGLGGTATAGIISAYGRDIGETFVDYIQIDAPINRGNSGGPTFDVYGRVIGVNTAIFSPSGGSVGIGFAIPADLADSVTKQLIRGGKIERGYIGATIQNFTTEMAEAAGLGEQKGAIVADLTPGGPSQRAGLQVGDVVTAINGTAVRSSSELTRQVARAKPGDSLRLDVIREGRRRTVEVRAGTRPSERELAAANDNLGGQGAPGGEGQPQASPSALGLTLGVVTDAMRSRLNLPADVRGAVVESVDQNSDAASKGLRRGDVITRANNRAINSPAELVAVVEEAKKAGRTSVLVGVFRNGRTSFLPLKVSG
ncbi:serine protease HtrA [Phenylobacterium zucineum HLK1]|uniref:Serine protease HtrA n=1 Tax=Phenylobacterium zucineum (strain HLK1) TaxID=450851 RepID=B4RHQ7_PHEZH|nr:Do family serine endopeptidase [Phenylobacterium zucineum]ACG79098.1 serine protease HtrA [Phenylobacterium zucineum HLK1]